MDEIQLCAQGLCLKEMMGKLSAKVCCGTGKLATASPSRFQTIASQNIC